MGGPQLHGVVQDQRLGGNLQLCGGYRAAAALGGGGPRARARRAASVGNPRGPSTPFDVDLVPKGGTKST